MKRTIMALVRLYVASALLVAVAAGWVSAADAPDAWLTMKTKISLMTTEGLSTLDLNVDTVQGVVTLHGKVPTESEKAKAEATARRIDGVKDVKNLLQVVSDSSKKAVERTDDQIKDAVVAAFKANKRVSDSGIKVQSVNKGVVLLMRALRAVALRVDDGMGEEQIAVAAMGVVIPYILREPFAPLREEIRAFGPRHQHRVEIVGRAADHTESGVGPDLHGPTALDQIGVAARDHEGTAGPLAAVGIGHDLAMLRLRLQIVELRDRLNGPLKDRIGRDVADAPPGDPNLSRRRAQALDVRFSVSRCHQ